MTRKKRLLTERMFSRELQSANGLKRVPQQKRSQQLIESICESTLVILNRNGVKALSTNRIAETAGIPPTSLYRFFENKEAILRFIVSRWMREIRKTWDRFESDEELLRLDWRAYFIALFNAWQSDNTQRLYSGLSGVWNFFPELKELEDEHRAYFVEFFIGQMTRFAANGSCEHWRNLAIFLYMVEDEVHGLAANHMFSDLESGRALFLETALNQLGKLLRPN